MEDILLIFSNRFFLILNISEINLVDFSQIKDTSIETLITSIDKTKVIIKWDGAIPTFVSSLTTAEGPYNYNQIFSILNTNIWSSPKL